ncbi:Inner centromere protein A, partial [Nestor notabilis]
EKERQRLESLRKKQEAEEQRKKKMEEEKRRRQAEMKQKREERLRKALQARERAEEEKKKRMEQKILQSDEKVWPSQMREEKVEERGRKKLSKKSGEADARKQKALRVVRAALAPSCRLFFFLQEEDEFEQQEPLQKMRKDEVKEKGKKVLELKSLLEQQQVEQGKERYCLGSAIRSRPADVGWSRKRSPAVRAVGLQPAAVQRWGWLRLGQSSAQEEPEVKTSRLYFGKDESCWRWPPDGSAPRGGRAGSAAEAPELLKADSGSNTPKVSEDNYGMDQNSDDATDDENDPRKPVPAWADGPRLNQDIVHQYYHPVNTDQLFGLISGLRLEEIFGKRKPRYFKRTSSAVWHSPP